MHDHLKCQSSTQWVPRELKNWETNGTVLTTPLMICRWRRRLLNRIAIGDESWAYHYQPESNCASVQWKYPSSPSTKKFKVTSMPSVGKVMLTLFWDSQGVLLTHFHKHDENVNSALYCDILLKLRNAICRKRPGQLRRGILLHHDNARPYTARATQERIQELQQEILEHLPYSLDLAPSDFHLFHPLKTTLAINIPLMMKRLKRRNRSGQDNSQKTYILWGLTH
jgi:histone-lysine N-methyltransferase SETMAR